MAAKTIIEINGRKYDALTGRIVHDENATVSPKNSTTQAQPVHTGVIDGFQRPKRKLQSSISPKLQSRNKTQRSQTLARNVVKKPAPTKTPKVASQSQPVKRELSIAETRRRILSKVPVARIERAESTKQSKSVTRFASTNNVPKPVITPHLAVARENVANAAPLPMPSAPPITVKTQSTAHPTKKQEFTHPLAGANAHLAIAPKKRKIHQKVADRLSISPRAVSMVAACLAIVLLGSFFAYQKIPNISMKVAAARAGFTGTVPATTPAGYAFSGPIKYEKDVIVVSYKSNSDNRQFKIVQRPSNWSSEALLTNFVNGTNLRYQTYSDKGLTVYILDSNSAAWVDNGIWYSLSGTNTLSTEQILAMAASM